MPLWRILNQMLQNEQLIQKMADSAPIRRLAKFIASTYYSNYDRMNDTAQRVLQGQSLQKRVDQFSEKFKRELKKELDDVKKKSKEQQR